MSKSDYKHRWPEPIPPSRTARQQCTACATIRFGAERKPNGRGYRAMRWSYLDASGHIHAEVPPPCVEKKDRVR